MSVNIINTGLTHALQGMADKWDLVQLNPVIIFPEEDNRGMDLCCHSQLVLADATGIANQNDINGFMFQLAAATDILVMTLQKNNVNVATLNSNALGTYYALGTIVYYTDQSLLIGYSLEWSKVLAAYGIGSYRIKIIYTSFGGANTYYSQNFILKTFSNDVANGTIRIESYMNGYMMRERINYKGINFVDMMRVRGWFGNSEEKLETTNDVYANYIGEKRVIRQRKINQIEIYNLELLPLPKCLADKIRYYHFLANEIYMSDYNIYNYDYDLKRIQIYKDTAFDFKYSKSFREIIISGKISEAIQDVQKTSC